MEFIYQHRGKKVQEKRRKKNWIKRKQVVNSLIKIKAANRACWPINDLGHFCNNNITTEVVMVIVNAIL